MPAARATWTLPAKSRGAVLVSSTKITCRRRHSLTHARTAWLWTRPLGDVGRDDNPPRPMGEGADTLTVSRLLPRIKAATSAVSPGRSHLLIPCGQSIPPMDRMTSDPTVKHRPLWPQDVPTPSTSAGEGEGRKGSHVGDGAAVRHGVAHEGLELPHRGLRASRDTAPRDPFILDIHFFIISGMQ